MSLPKLADYDFILADYEFVALPLVGAGFCLSDALFFHNLVLPCTGGRELAGFLMFAGASLSVSARGLRAFPPPAFCGRLTRFCGRLCFALPFYLPILFALFVLYLYRLKTLLFYYIIPSSPFITHHHHLLTTTRVHPPILRRCRQNILHHPPNIKQN